MTNRAIAAAIVRIALLPPSEWTDEDLTILLKPEERLNYPATPEPWLVRGRATVMLARVLERVFEFGGDWPFPSDEDALEFSVSEPGKR